jgi:hypothetical protein
MMKPHSPEDWQLFPVSDEVDAETRTGAAIALSRSLERAEDAVRRGVDPEAAYEQYMVPVALEFAAVGAADTEPAEVAMLYLTAITRNAS